MKDLTLAQMQSLGINKWMSDKEIEKAISKALSDIHSYRDWETDRKSVV